MPVILQPNLAGGRRSDGATQEWVSREFAQYELAKQALSPGGYRTGDCHCYKCQRPLSFNDAYLVSDVLDPEDCNGFYCVCGSCALSR